MLDAASSLGIATLINRPFGTGNLFNREKGKALPGWAIENEMETRSEYFLKYIIANSAVTCIIPATGNPEHEDQNVKAGAGELPGKNLKK